MDELPEFAIIIEKLNTELEEERTKYENKINKLETQINILKKKYEPERNTLTLIHHCIRNCNHYNIAKVIHALNRGQFKCISLKKREWMKKDQNGNFVPIEGEVHAKKMIEDSVIVFHNEIRKIEELIENNPDHPMYDTFHFGSNNINKIYSSLQTEKTRNHILRELREQFYDNN